MAITYTFKGGRGIHGYGYYAYVEDDQLVIGEDWPREGGDTFRGNIRDATKALEELKKEAPALYDNITKYYEDELKNIADEDTQLKQKLSYDDKTKTILFKVQLFMDNRQVHNALVRGRFQADVINKLMPKIPEVLTLQTYSGNVFAVRSEKISAVVFMED